MSPSSRQPSQPDRGRPEQGEVELEAAESAQAEAQQEAADQAAAGEESGDKPPPARARRRKAPEAEGTAAEATGEQKEVAQAAKKARRRRDEAPAAAPGSSRDGATGPVVRAQARYVRSSARKARLVCDHIRGKSVEDARAVLAHTNRQVARDWAKLLESAVANAEHNHELVEDDLRIYNAFADEGPTLKRFQPRAQGRATRIRKRTSHLTITLTPGGGRNR